MSRRSVEQRKAVSRGTETILVVEDDESLREVACQFLQGSGYTVLPEESQEEALRLAESYDGPIDFLLTDVIMPKMNGREPATRLSKVRPGMKVLYVSGYADGAVREGVHGPLEEGLAFLQKLFERRVLAWKIRESSIRVRPNLSATKPEA